MSGFSPRADLRSDRSSCVTCAQLADVEWEFIENRTCRSASTARTRCGCGSSSRGCCGGFGGGQWREMPAEFGAWSTVPPTPASPASSAASTSSGRCSAAVATSPATPNRPSRTRLHHRAHPALRLPHQRPPAARESVHHRRRGEGGELRWRVRRHALRMAGARTGPRSPAAPAPYGEARRRAADSTRRACRGNPQGPIRPRRGQPRGVHPAAGRAPDDAEALTAAVSSAIRRSGPLSTPPTSDSGRSPGARSARLPDWCSASSLTMAR